MSALCYVYNMMEVSSFPLIQITDHLGVKEREEGALRKKQNVSS